MKGSTWNRYRDDSRKVAMLLTAITNTTWNTLKASSAPRARVEAPEPRQHSGTCRVAQIRTIGTST